MSVKTLAEKLDEKVPGWFFKVNLLTLDLHHPDTCILGQVYGDYTAEKAVYVSRADNEVPEFDDNKYRPAWIKEIQQRRAAVQQAFKAEMRDAILAGDSRAKMLEMIGGVSTYTPGTVLLLKNECQVIRTGDDAWILVTTIGRCVKCTDAYVMKIGVIHAMLVNSVDRC